MEKCPRCGAIIKPEDKFCGQCGATLNENNTNPHDEKGFIGDFIRGGSAAVRARRAERAGVYQQPASNRVRPEETYRSPISGNTNSQYNSFDAAARQNLDIDVVRGKAIWDIHPGQIGRRITEAEFAQIEQLSGVIIQDGCTAFVYVNGKFVDAISGGAIVFSSRSDAEVRADLLHAETEVDTVMTSEEIQRRRLNGGAMGGLGLALRNLGRFLFGRKAADTPSQAREREERIRARLSEMREQDYKDVRVYLFSNRVFTLTYGGKANEDGTVDFEPFDVQTALSKVKMGVSMQFLVDDATTCKNQYLAEQNSFTTSQLFALTKQPVINCVCEKLRNYQYTDSGLDETTKNELRAKLASTINQCLFGIKVAAVLDITDNNEDLNRFRAVEHELYCSERELGYLQRTNEFRNRLVAENNSQQIFNARSEEELRQTLDRINRDGLLYDDEKEKFVQMLESQRRLRIANTAEEEYEALQKLQASRLLSDDDMAALSESIARKVTNRNNVSELLRIQAARSINEANLQTSIALDRQKMAYDMEREFIIQGHKQEFEDRNRLHEHATEETNQTHEYGMENRSQAHTQGLEERNLAHTIDMEDQGQIHSINMENRGATHSLTLKRMLDEYNDVREERDYEHGRRDSRDIYDDMVRDNDYKWMQTLRLVELNRQNEDREYARQLEQEKTEYERKLELERLAYEREREQQQTSFEQVRTMNADALDALVKKGQIAQANMEAMMAGELALEKENNRSAEVINSQNTEVQKNRDNVEAGMNSEALMAKHASELSEPAQTAYAESLGSRKENELRIQQQAEFNAMYQQMLQMQQQQNNLSQEAYQKNQENIMKMFELMQQGMITISASQQQNVFQQYNQQMQFQNALHTQQTAFQEQRIADEQAMKQEYRDNALHQQERVDANQQQSLNYTTETRKAETMSAQIFPDVRMGMTIQPSCGPIAAPVYCICPSCSAKILSTQPFCTNCGHRMGTVEKDEANTSKELV